MKIYTADDSNKVRKALKQVRRDVEQEVKRRVSGIESQIAIRAYRVANVVRDKEQALLTGKRSGERYPLPGKSGRWYQASAPGEPPANRTGAFRLKWGTFAEIRRGWKSLRALAGIRSRHKVKGGYLLGDLLEDGTSRMAPRPYKKKITEDARKEAVKIYNRPYRR
jgi:hypothetical protein